jgi:hypothetical protein
MRQSLNVSYTRKVAALQRRLDWLEGMIPQRQDDRSRQEAGALKWAIKVIEANKTSAKSIIETHRLEQDAINGTH